jgi:hypothetical protein
VEWVELTVEWVEAEVVRVEPTLGGFLALLLNGIKAVDSGTILAMYLGRGGETVVSKMVKSWTSCFEPLTKLTELTVLIGLALPKL